MKAIILEGLELFLEKFPEMSTVPSLKPGTILRGNLYFRANISEGREIEDNYCLEIFVPEDFPRKIPNVKETGGKITRDIANGHFLEDGSLCLGSHLRLLNLCHRDPTLIGFTYKCLIPYLYAISHKLQYGGELIFGELEHGVHGLIEDYSMMLNLKTTSQIKQALSSLSQKKRIANKKLCPCGCGKRLGVCSLHHILNKFRKMTYRSVFRTHLILHFRDL